jgi:L-seryl-tRNA(Ser) seleniumtransferase
MPRSLSELPSVERLASAVRARAPELAPWAADAARAEIDLCRKAMLAGDRGALTRAVLVDSTVDRARSLGRPSLRGVVNATGVVLHTNLGRAPMAAEAVDAVTAVASGYSTLEYDLERGTRGHRSRHVDELLRALSGAEAGHAVNNNAAAVVLALAALAAGGEVLISRGEMIEIGDAFRIPEIAELAGVKLVEVGTTNRTRLVDYERALGARTTGILRVHQSNFRTVGFTSMVPLIDLARLAHAHDLPLIDDLGSGAVAPFADEPVLKDSVAATVDLTCCSADKLLGGPQAGLIVGRADAVARCRRHPLARVVRLDKLQLAALEATLRIHREDRRSDLPVHRMLHQPVEDLVGRVDAMIEAIGPAASRRCAQSRPGGGSLPLVELEGPVCVVAAGQRGPETLVADLRRCDPPVVARISGGRLVLDPRTMTDAEAQRAAELVASALGRPDA